MGKQQYLEQLYTALQAYDIDSSIRHVTEYDYIISDMLEGETFEYVLKTLGSPDELAANIAEEFNYELRDKNQFEEPLISKKSTYISGANHALKVVINIIFILITISYIISIFAMLATSIALFAVSGIFSFSAAILTIIILIFTLFALSAIYMFTLNFRRYLLIRFIPNQYVPKPHFKIWLISFIVSFVLLIAFSMMFVLATGIGIYTTFR